jgi:antiviral helicase SLH1
VDDFALISDTAYVAQNAGRIARALLEIAISRKWASVAAILMGLSKAIERRLWPDEQPLRQFDLKPDVLYGLDNWASGLSVAELASFTAAELGELVHLNEMHGQAILSTANRLPRVHIDYRLLPLGFDVLRIAVQITRAFDWSAKIHGSFEPFWFWIEDDEESILQLWHLAFHQGTTSLNVTFDIRIPNGQAPPAVTIKFVSDRWIGAEDHVFIPLEGLVMPPPWVNHSPKLDLPFLPLSSVRNSAVEAIFTPRMDTFNAIQTQVFWSVIHTRMNSLICAPTGCGKSLLGQILVWSVQIDN